MIATLQFKCSRRKLLPHKTDRKRRSKSLTESKWLQDKFRFRCTPFSRRITHTFVCTQFETDIWSLDRGTSRISVSGEKWIYPNSSRRTDQGRKRSEVDVFNDFLKGSTGMVSKKRQRRRNLWCIGHRCEGFCRDGQWYRLQCIRDAEKSLQYAGHLKSCVRWHGPLFDPVKLRNAC